MTQLEALQRNGIQRLGTARSGFRYRRAGGGKVSAAERERISALRLPPAWTKVAINPSPTANLQAVGMDAAGRWQYRYSPAFVARRQRRKFHRLLRFAHALPRMRQAVARGLRGQALDHDRVMACVLRILSTCFIRPGSQAYADEHGAYGLATLLKRHVTVKGDLVAFDFTGKSAQRQHRELRDRRVARVVRALIARSPGKPLFQYQNGDGAWVDVRRGHINRWIKAVMGEGFSAKDFRTWAGTLLCATALAKAGCVDGESKAARKKKVVAAVKETADHLGNTAAVCRSAYIEPSVLQGFAKGQVLACAPAQAASPGALPREGRGTGLFRTERALLSWLERSAKEAGAHKRSPRRAEARRAGRRARGKGRRGVARRGGV